MDLSTTYLGFTLPHPLMPGASPLVDDLDTVRRLEDAGAAAIVMRSLFEEQITREQLGSVHDIMVHEDSFAEALSYFPEPDEYALGPERYLEQLRNIKAAVGVPVIASLNGTSAKGWIDYAKYMQEAGADAVEINFYHVATDLDESGPDVERRLLDVVSLVKQATTVPVAVKLSPFFSSLPHLAQQLDALHVEGLVLFNRFYQADIDPEALEATPSLTLSTSNALLPRVRALATLSGRVRASLAATGGVHTALDALKAVMAGAHAVQIVAALLQHGPQQLRVIRDELAKWLEDHEYESLQKAQGSMSLERCPDPSAFVRGNYMRVLQTWRLTRV